MATATNPAKRAPAKKTTTAAKAAPAKKAARPAAAVKAARAPESETAPGWYKDPADSTSLRYWDGEGWLGAPLPEGIVTGTVPAAEAPDDEAAGDTAEPAATITWQGRELAVQRPTPGMVAVWVLSAKEYARTNVESMSVKDQLNASGRLVQVVVSVLADQDDRDWVQDLLLTNRVSLEEIPEIMTLTNDAYQLMSEQGGSRAERRQASKARRR